jgi:hypothetical protein
MIRASACSWRQWFGENGVVEWAQVFLAIGAACVLFARAVWYRMNSGFYAGLGMLMLCLVVRELDRYFGRFSPLQWSAMSLVLLGAVIFAFRTKPFWVNLHCFVQTRAFVILGGGILILCISQVLGQTWGWKQILGPHVYHPAKAVVEESIECFGYIVLLFGAVETLVERGDKKSMTASSQARSCNKNLLPPLEHAQEGVSTEGGRV